MRPTRAKRHGDADSFLDRVGLKLWAAGRKTINVGEYAPRNRYNLWIVTPTDRARVGSGDRMQALVELAQVVLNNPKTPTGSRVEIASEPPSGSGRLLRHGYEPLRAWLKMGAMQGYRSGNEWMEIPIKSSELEPGQPPAIFRVEGYEGQFKTKAEAERAAQSRSRPTLSLDDDSG